MRKDCNCSYCKEKVNEYFCLRCGHNYNECEVHNYFDEATLCPKCQPKGKHSIAIFSGTLPDHPPSTKSTHYPEGLSKAALHEENGTYTFTRCISLMDISNDILEGMKGVKKEMEEKGLLNENTTFEEMADYAGRHVLLTDTKEIPSINTP